jgi:hypothetical protein
MDLNYFIEPLPTRLTIVGRAVKLYGVVGKLSAARHLRVRAVRLLALFVKAILE